MNVRLAAQVLSSTVSKTLTTFWSCWYCDVLLVNNSFFDIMNIRNIRSHEFKRKPFLTPFTSVNDDWFGWLQDVFLKYFEDWLTSIWQRPGNFSRNARRNMLISWQTFEGRKITVHSIIEAVPSATSCQKCFDRKVLSRTTWKLLWSAESNWC